MTTRAPASAAGFVAPSHSVHMVERKPVPAVADSSTSRLAGGFGGTWSILDPDRVHRTWTDLRLALAYPLSDRIRDEASDLLTGSGVLHLYVPHTTAGICVNEGADPDVVADLGRVLERLVPWTDGYRHAEGNAAAHLKAAIVGTSVLAPRTPIS